VVYGIMSSESQTNTRLDDVMLKMITSYIPSLFTCISYVTYEYVFNRMKLMVWIVLKI
jgi:hypothetical protein